MTALFWQLLLLAVLVAVAYSLMPKPWAQPELRILEHEDGVHFRVQYRVHALWYSYWVDVEHVQSAGKRLPWVYPSRSMAEAYVREIRRKHELRNPRSWR